jgi:pSer/pThr/pTyr-binding forkhead associated (FHA) protein
MTAPTPEHSPETLPAEYGLFVRRGPQPDTAYPLNKEVINIGRDESNDITIDDIEISRFHARIIRQEGAYKLIDLDSMNGTYVEGQKLSKAHSLSLGEKIGVGESVLLSFEKWPPASS